MPIRRAGLTLLAIALVAVPTASAGTPGKWTQLGQRNLANIDEVALARTADGTLHAVWTVPAPNSDSLVHAAISKAGGVLAPDVIQSGWAGIEPVPDLVATSSGLRVFFGGLRTTNSTEPNQWLNTATAPVGGSPWDLFVGAVARGDASHARGSGDALLADGAPVLSWGGTGSGVYIHRGLDPN